MAFGAKKRKAATIQMALLVHQKVAASTGGGMTEGMLALQTAVAKGKGMVAAWAQMRKTRTKKKSTGIQRGRMTKQKMSSNQV